MLRYDAPLIAASQRPVRTTVTHVASARPAQGQRNTVENWHPSAYKNRAGWVACLLEEGGHARQRHVVTGEVGVKGVVDVGHAAGMKVG